jgi:hypothetical protein
MDTQLWTLGIVAVIALFALAVWLRSRKKQSYRLLQHFAPKHGHAVDELGSRANAEAEVKTPATRD